MRATRRVPSATLCALDETDAVTVAGPVTVMW